ncbi:S41 family peptidase [Ascidiimonas aurantiaca]|uniref:S41 family peptidase n=1 Tax=Ascidiimonas aurantiaca TaxID=1685432 RepID=UPI0030EB691D
MTSKTNFIGIIGILFFTLNITFAQAQILLDKKLLEEDLDILYNNLKTLHGGLFAYTSEQDVEQWFLNTQAKLNDNIDVFEFYKHIAPLNSIIKNGHTQVKYPALSQKFKMLPIQVYCHDGNYFIKHQFNNSNGDLIGLKIKQIDGKSIEDIFSRLLTHQTRDGNNLTFPIENLSSLFGFEYSFVYGQKDEYLLTVVDNDGAENTITLSTVSLNSEIVERLNNSLIGALNFKIIGDTAIITFPTFDTKSLRKRAYKKFLAKSFSAIRKMNITKLIIDVRNNAGGDPKPTQELLSYLLENDFILYEDVYTITNRIEDAAYYKNQGVFWLNTFSWLKVKKVENQRFERFNKEGLKIYRSKRDYYKGDLTVLINGNSFSATGEFASFLKHYRSSIFIGEEVGGNGLQSTAGVTYTLTLPHSKINIDIPLVVFKLNVPVENPTHGVIPDYQVRNTITQELNGEDAVMDFALKLNSKKK